MGKKVDKAKEEAKKARQAAKQMKSANKRDKKELAAEGEESIEAILASFSDTTRKLGKVRPVVVAPCSQPPRRSNFSLTSLPTGEMLMFGGEVCRFHAS